MFLTRVQTQATTDFDVRPIQYQEITRNIGENPDISGNIDDIRENLLKYPPTDYWRGLSCRLGPAHDISPIYRVIYPIFQTPSVITKESWHLLFFFFF